MNQPSPIDQLDTKNTLLFECAWEVCNQVGGIYTVIRSKSQAIVDKWNKNYTVIGPYLSPIVLNEFELLDLPRGPVGEVLKIMRDSGFEVHFGRWLVAGSPYAILFNPNSIMNQLGSIKYFLWDHHQIPTRDTDLINRVICFGELLRVFFYHLDKRIPPKANVIAHFHEWMAGTAIPGMRRNNLKTRIVFTTHATILGRYLAMNKHPFYERLPYFRWEQEAKEYDIETEVHIERAAAHGCHLLSTVSEVTARECAKLLDREPDIILPNGLNIEKFSTPHEFQVVHNEYKKKIHQFVMGHFFSSYSFDLDNTLYFFTSGRYEYTNKGFDLTIEALARLNYKMQYDNIDKTVVMFIITPRPYHNINPTVYKSQMLLDKLDKTCEMIQEIVGDRLFFESISNKNTKIPDLNAFIPEYWKLRFRRTILSWQTQELPLIVTHDLVQPEKDEILNFLDASRLVNNAHDKVKVIYHPEFISTISPINKLEYEQFVKGCHLGIFPSYYEPWGYTPLECMARGIPAVTSDLSGFGDYVLKTVPDSHDHGIYVINRSTQSFSESAEELANQLFEFTKMSRGERVRQRYRVESIAEDFDWKYLSEYYNRAYSLVLID